MNIEAQHQDAIREFFVGVKVCLGGQLVSIYSGFVVEIHGTWHWVSASHCFEHLDTQILKVGADPGSFGVEWLLASPIDPVLAFAYKPGMAFRFDEHAKGLLAEGSSESLDQEVFEAFGEMDIGVLRLSDYDVMVLRSQGVRALTRDAVVSIQGDQIAQHLECHHYLLLVGLPSETLAVDQEKISLLALPVAIAQKQPEFNRKTAISYLEPKWEATLFNGDVKGMSGGPILAVGDKGIRLVGVMSARLGQEGKRPKRLTVIASEYVFDVIDRCSQAA